VNPRATGDERIALAAAFRVVAEVVDREAVWRAGQGKRHEAKALVDVAAVAASVSQMCGG